MASISVGDLEFLRNVANLAYANPFLPERTEWERAALGREYKDTGPVWSATVGEPEHLRVNAWTIHARAEGLIETIPVGSLNRAQREIYFEAAEHTLYQRYFLRMYANYSGGKEANWSWYKEFAADHARWLGARQEGEGAAEHLFACFWQVLRAFLLIYDQIIGGSLAAAELRATIWQSIFTADLRAYSRFFYRQMGDYCTLITGPSGTGKELVARAIAGARYIPFDRQRLRFGGGQEEQQFFPINLAALPTTLLESELFGHRKGTFTGATMDRKGWLESCPATGTVFLDELGELEQLIQVKLLRVLEAREFSVLGESGVRKFLGKMVAATNRDLAREIGKGTFREDLYYRLCADQIRTPSMAEQIQGEPGVFDELVLYMTRRVCGEAAGEREVGRAVGLVRDWMAKHLPKGYAWPGNYRELEQCVRNILIRGTYRPLAVAREAGGGEAFFEAFAQGSLSADAVLREYLRRIYATTGSYEETARRTGLDRRTVKARLQAESDGADG